MACLLRRLSNDIARDEIRQQADGAVVAAAEQAVLPGSTHDDQLFSTGSYKLEITVYKSTKFRLARTNTAIQQTPQTKIEERLDSNPKLKQEKTRNDWWLIARQSFGCQITSLNMIKLSCIMPYTIYVYKVLCVHTYMHVRIWMCTMSAQTSARYMYTVPL